MKDKNLNNDVRVLKAVRARLAEAARLAEQADLSAYAENPSAGRIADLASMAACEFTTIVAMLSGDRDGEPR